VNKRTHANIIIVNVLDFMNRTLSCEVYVDKIGGVILSDWVIEIVDSIKIRIEIIAGFINRVWLGIIATKYENITSIPPM